LRTTCRTSSWEGMKGFKFLETNIIKYHFSVYHLFHSLAKEGIVVRNYIPWEFKIHFFIASSRIQDCS
jgi:hypothetical protein